MDSDAPMSRRRDVFELEVLKLLLQVVWADLETTDEEVKALMARARGMGISEAHERELETYLRGGAPLPPPNLGLLKARKVEVLREVRQVIEKDLAKLGSEEEEILQAISQLLGG